jgi:hypothetical protein
MPIQLNEDEFLQFKFDPDYLKAKKYRHLFTDPMDLNLEMRIHAHYSEIRIDGGNTIKGKSWVIITDKIFSDNAERSKRSLVDDIEHLLKSRLIIIPRPPYDFTGHADGEPVLQCSRFQPSLNVSISQLSHLATRVHRKWQQECATAEQVKRLILRFKNRFSALLIASYSRHAGFFL